MNVARKCITKCYTRGKKGVLSLESNSVSFIPQGYGEITSVFTYWAKVTRDKLYQYSHCLHVYQPHHPREPVVLGLPQPLRQHVPDHPLGPHEPNVNLLGIDLLTHEVILYINVLRP